ncbi:MAG: hypothetical protein WED04_02610 [Promethearchaeati archaeon SRVP18_Atabeyarchaeia-1]
MTKNLASYRGGMTLAIAGFIFSLFGFLSVMFSSGLSWLQGLPLMVFGISLELLGIAYRQ